MHRKKEKKLKIKKEMQFKREMEFSLVEKKYCYYAHTKYINLKM